MKGILYGVGVGPGDPELLTLKAVRTIERCEVIAVPDSGSGERLALSIAQQYLGGKEMLDCPMPMTHDKVVLRENRARVAKAISEVLESGRSVAYLTIGDPTVYATYSYLHRLVAEAGYEARFVPGIPSFCAAAAALGEPLCEAGQALHILPASLDQLERALDAPGTKVLMKMGRSRDEVLELLRRKDLLEKASMVERCTLPDEEITRDLENLSPEAGYFSMVIVQGDE